MTAGTEAPFLTAAWRHLAMVNFTIDPGVLAPFVPRGTALDTWEGRTFVSLVGFQFLDTRVLGVAIPFHRDFEEVNLRFYVRRHAPDGWRRGVVFVREIVPRRAIAWVARWRYEEPYIALPMRHRVELPDSNGARDAPGLVEYGWRTSSSRSHHLRVRPIGEPRPSEPGSEEEFITEHYWGYTARRHGRTDEYRVEHPRWRVWQVAESEVNVEAAALYGASFARVLDGPPSSAFLADGSPVAVYRGRRLSDI